MLDKPKDPVSDFNARLKIANEKYSQRERDRVFGRGEWINGWLIIDYSKPDKPSHPIDGRALDGTDQPYLDMNNPDSEGAGL